MSSATFRPALALSRCACISADDHLNRLSVASRVDPVTGKEQLLSQRIWTMDDGIDAMCLHYFIVHGAAAAAP